MQHFMVEIPVRCLRPLPHLNHGGTEQREHRERKPAAEEVVDDGVFAGGVGTDQGLVTVEIPADGIEPTGCMLRLVRLEVDADRDTAVRRVMDFMAAADQDQVG